MKQITRLGPDDPLANLKERERFWLNQDGRWERDRAQAFAFDDAEAARRLRRLPRAIAIDPGQEPADAAQ